MKEKKHVDGAIQIFKAASIQGNCGKKVISHLFF